MSKTQSNLTVLVIGTILSSNMLALLSKKWFGNRKA